ncbi:hypothetical protein Acr_00g0011650 [Actinidia rufa]|uniref:Uncharacterized protein n=1 Tax=Actinidia rufa TaxID=165716 RepID=A0A7J0DB68_9ERIC|nr:hypothetical protein Acr_00g0011650 [Actinidia rufa]
MVSSKGNNGDDLLAGSAVPIVGDEGKSHHSLDNLTKVMVLTSSVTSWGRKMRDEVMIQLDRATSIENEMTHAQKLASDLERQLVEGFDFCKRQIRCHHPNLSIVIEGMGIGTNLLEEKEDTKEENE